MLGKALSAVGDGLGKVAAALKKWVVDMQRSLRSSPKAPFGSISPSEIRKWQFENRKRKGWDQKRMGPGVWSVGLEMIRDWLPELQGKILEAGYDEIDRAAHHMAALVKLAIHSQAYKWKPLTERYIKWKKKKDLDTRILIATGEYVQSIQVSRDEGGQDDDPTRVAYIVGLPDKIHTASGLPIRKLAAIHEFGAPKARIPARPVWRPTWELAKSEAKEKILARMKKTAQEEAKKFQLELQRAMPGVTIKVRQS